ncbi:MAG: DNA-binding MarR family transcriptional regulator [Halobacteriales archaeon]|jgi:DNA-binding MarR family transcriptional regulator
MSTSAAAATDLTDKQQRILAYLRRKGETKTYFKSRLIGEDLGMTAKEVGTNMTAIANGDFDVDVEKWGYSSSTTWQVSV